MNQITAFIKTYLLYWIVILGFILGYVLIEFIPNTKLFDILGDWVWILGIYENYLEDNDKQGVEFIWFGFLLGFCCLVVDYLYQLYRPRPFIKRFIHACATVFVVIVTCSFIFEMFGSCDHHSFFSDSSTSKCNKDRYNPFFNYPNMTLIADFIGLAIGIGIMIFLENFPIYRRIGSLIKNLISYLRP